MNIETAKKLTYEKIRSEYRNYLHSLGLSKSTIDTYISDAFYLWNNRGRDVFWDTITNDDFENTAHDILYDALSEYSSGDAQVLANDYTFKLKKFRGFLSEDSQDSEKNDYTALKEFLLDIDCLNPLTEWTRHFNIFEILKISKAEIRHSNVLAWLLNPNETHGLSDNILRGFFQYYASSFSDDSDVFDILLTDYYSFSVQREWQNIDILVVSYDEEILLCIENKTDSGEHDNQLNRYRKRLENSFPNFKRLYIYLSPTGVESSDPENWCSMSYQDVLDIIDEASNKTALSPEAALLIDSYKDTIRRHIVGDEKLAQICAKIYSKHQQALDLIFENKPDRAQELSEIFHRWAQLMADKGKVIYVADKSGKTYTRFKTEALSALLPDAENALSGWNTHNFYFYEICNNDGKEFHLQLAFSSKNIPDDLRSICDQIADASSKSRKTNWLWFTSYTTRRIKVKDDEELVEEKIFEHLDKLFTELMTNEATIISKIASREQNSPH